MRIDAAKAESWGLINEVVELEDLHLRAAEIAGEIVENGPLAVQMTKQLIDGGVSANHGFYLESLASGMARFTEDANEGISAFKEKREAVFKGA